MKLKALLLTFVMFSTTSGWASDCALSNPTALLKKTAAKTDSKGSSKTSTVKE